MIITQFTLKTSAFGIDLLIDGEPYRVSKGVWPIIHNISYISLALKQLFNSCGYASSRMQATSNKTQIPKMENMSGSLANARLILQRLSEATQLSGAESSAEDAAVEVPRFNDDEIEDFCHIRLDEQEGLTFWQGLSDAGISIGNVGR